MFTLISRGQTYTDGQGWPATVHGCEGDNVLFWRRHRIERVSLSRFNREFEHTSYAEHRSILAEIEQTDHISALRAQQRTRRSEQP